MTKSLRADIMRMSAGFLLSRGGPESSQVCQGGSWGLQQIGGSSMYPIACYFSYPLIADLLYEGRLNACRDQLSQRGDPLQPGM